MNKETILKKAIKQAVKNGWTEYGEDWHKDSYKFLIEQKKHYFIIFNHLFAKAFWKNQLGIDGYKGWELGLQQMVVEKEPLLYLKKFLK